MRTGKKTFGELLPDIKELIKEYYISRGKDISDEMIRSSINYTTEFIPDRVSEIYDILKSYDRYFSFENSSVLDVGCGFGMISLYIKLNLKAKYIFAVDIDKSLVSVFKKITQKFHISSIDICVGNMSNIPSRDSMFDIVVSYDSFLYRSIEKKRAIKEFYRVLKRDGILFIRAANKLFPIEAFTGIPLVQFLPRNLADVIVRLSGRKETYKHVSLPDPLSLYLLFRFVGFKNIKIYRSIRLGGRSKILPFFLSPAFVIVGRKS